MSAPAKSRTGKPSAMPRPRRVSPVSHQKTERIPLIPRLDEPVTQRIPRIIDELTQEIPAVRGAPQGVARRQEVYLHGLDALRLLASCIVVYTHICGWYGAHGVSWSVQGLVSTLIADPLRTDPALGFAAVSAFFMISGVVVTQVAVVLPPGKFLARRFVRIMPALCVAVLLGWLLVNMHVMPAVGGATSAGVDSLLSNVTLANYAMAGQVMLLPVTWTLLVEIVFYLFLAATMPMLRRRPWLVPAIAAVTVSVLLSVVHIEHPPILHVVRIIVTYLPVLFLGHVIALVRVGKLHPLAGFGYGVVFYLLFLRADLTSVHTPGIAGDERELVVVLLVMLLLTRASGRLVRSRWITVLSVRTYAIYLVHLPVAYAALELLSPRLGYPNATLVGLLAVAVLAEALYRFVEHPVEQLYRRWERSRRARADGRTAQRPERPIRSPLASG